MKYRCLALILFLFVAYSKAAEVSGESVLVTFEATYLSPSCTLFMPSTVELGIFHKGITENIPDLFDIEINCPNSGKYRTWLVASLGGSYVDSTQIPLTSGSSLSLFVTEHTTGEVNPIRFDGTTKFCISNAPQSANVKCSVSPTIDIPMHAESGFFSSSIVITLGYN
jgi:hypothetical protein